jgi:hypothetical protein
VELRLNTHMTCPFIHLPDHSALAQQISGTLDFVSNVPQGTVMTLRIHDNQLNGTHDSQLKQAECSDINIINQRDFQAAFSSPYSISSTRSISSAGSVRKSGLLSPTPPPPRKCTADNELRVQFPRILVS